MVDGSSPLPGSELRVSDAEREEVVEVLREQTAAGRLTLGEFEERLDDVFGAKTRGELQRALRELPVQPPLSLRHDARPEDVSDEELRERYRVRLRGQIAGFATPNFVCNLIWLLGDAGYWWPGWVLMGTGVGLLTSVIRGFDREKERNELMAERRKQAMKEIESRRSVE